MRHYLYSSARNLLQLIHKVQSEKELYHLYAKHKDLYTPRLLLESLRALNLCVKTRHSYDFQEPKKEFLSDIMTTYSALPLEDKWRFCTPSPKN